MRVTGKDAGTQRNGEIRLSASSWQGNDILYRKSIAACCALSAGFLLLDTDYWLMDSLVSNGGFRN